LKTLGTQENADLRETTMTDKREMGFLANFFDHFLTGESNGDLYYSFFGYYYL